MKEILIFSLVVIPSIWITRELIGAPNIDNDGNTKMDKKMNLNANSVSLFVLLELLLWLGCGYLIYSGCDRFDVPKWLYKISLTCLILSPFGKMILGAFRCYWREDLNESIEDVDEPEQPKMKIYGSSKLDNI